MKLLPEQVYVYHRYIPQIRKVLNRECEAINGQKLTEKVLVINYVNAYSNLRRKFENSLVKRSL